MIESWLAAIRDHPGRPPATQRHVLTMLAVRLDWRTGQGFASTRQLMADADVSSATVERATKWARDSGLLKQVSRGRRLGDGSIRASEWSIGFSTHQQGGVETGAQSVTADSQAVAADGLRSGLNPSAGHSQPITGVTHQEPVVHQDVDRRSDRRLDRRSAADAADRATPTQWKFSDEQMPQVLAIIAEAARQHLNVIVDPSSQTTRYLLRTLTRSGRRFTRDIGKYAATSFAADPVKWRTLAVVAADNDGHVPDEGTTSVDYAAEVLSSTGPRARGDDYDDEPIEDGCLDLRYDAIGEQLLRDLDHTARLPATDNAPDDPWKDDHNAA